MVEDYEGLVQIQAFVDGQALLPISEPLMVEKASDYVVFDESLMSVMFQYPADYLIQQGKDPSDSRISNPDFTIMVAAFDNEGNLIEVEANTNDRLDAVARVDLKDFIERHMLVLSLDDGVQMTEYRVSFEISPFAEIIQ